MKKWERAEVFMLEVSHTEHQFKISCSFDGGYFGDGKVSGWFGPDPQPSVPSIPLFPATPNCPGPGGNS